jgi:hypothetical protein
MSEVHVKLLPIERDLLVRMLGAAMKGKRVEVRRTEFSRDMRHELEVEETQIEELLNKLTHAVEVGQT